MFELSSRQVAKELANDLQAFASDPTSLMFQPNFLRKASYLFDGRVPAGTTTIICRDDEIPLGAAISLCTGIPFKTLAKNSDPILEDGNSVFVGLNSAVGVIALADLVAEFEEK